MNCTSLRRAFVGVTVNLEEPCNSDVVGVREGVPAAYQQRQNFSNSSVQHPPTSGAPVVLIDSD